MTLFTRLHKDLRIPDGYHRTEIDGYWGRKIPPLSDEERELAIRKLERNGAIGGSTEQDLLDAIVERMGRLPNMPRGITRVAKPVVRMDPNVVAAILADPSGSPRDIAKRISRSSDTVRRYRKQLKDEGRIA